MTGRGSPAHRNDAAIAATKVIHSLAWFSIESCLLYVIHTGFTRRWDRRTVVAATVVAAETTIFAANGFRCPLTQLAEHYGAENGSVTDIYLPDRLAHSIPAIHAPLLVLAIYLHARNRRRPH